MGDDDKKEVNDMVKNNNTGLVVLVTVLVMLVLLMGGYLVYDKVLSKNNTTAAREKLDTNSNGNNIVENNYQEGDYSNPISTICTEEISESDKLKILSMESKTEKIGAIGGSTRGYNVTTTVTKKHNYTSTPNNEELYINDYLGTLFVLYKNKLYYTKQKEIISKYCETNNINGLTKLTCDYSKFNDTSIKEFNAVSIDVNLKAIGSYGNPGAGAPKPYAITTDGKVIQITEDSSHNYNGCRVMYDSSEYPIDRIFNMYFYDGVEYTILLKNGTLITRDVDRENPIEFEH